MQHIIIISNNNIGVVADNVNFIISYIIVIAMQQAENDSQKKQNNLKTVYVCVCTYENKTVTASFLAQFCNEISEAS